MAVRHRPQLRRVDLLISPAGYAFTIWAVIYLACIATGVVFVRTRVSGTPSAQRLTVDLAVACAAAASWLLVSAASIDWLPSVLLTVMVVVLIDAALIAARPLPTSMRESPCRCAPRWASTQRGPALRSFSTGPPIWADESLIRRRWVGNSRC